MKDAPIGDDGLTDDERAEMVAAFMAPPSEATNHALNEWRDGRYRHPGGQLPTEADRARLTEFRRTRVDREAYEKYGVAVPDAEERARLRDVLSSRAADREQ